MRSTFSPFLAATVAAVLTTLGAPAHAQARDGSQTTPREVQRGVPGTDVDLNTNGRAARNGVPGVDVDVGNPRRNNGVPGVDVDTRSSGANAEAMGGQSRAARADRN
jgi:hypothetical protein